MLYPDSDEDTRYEFCTIEEMLDYESEGDYSWLSFYSDESSILDEEDLEEIFGEEVNPDALIRKRIFFAQNSYSQLYIDFNPSELGIAGQIVAYIHDPDVYFQVSSSLAEFLKAHIDSNFENFYPDEEIAQNVDSSTSNDETQRQEENLEKLIKSFDSIPINNTFLDLELNTSSDWCGYFKDCFRPQIPIHGLEKLFAAIPRTIISLRLKNNMGTDQEEFSLLAQAFAFLPENLQTLDLSSNRLERMEGFILSQMFCRIPSGISNLFLNNNGLNRFSGEELAKAFDVLPQNITFLDLRFNRIGTMFCSQLRKFFQAMPRSITGLDLSGNGLSSRPGKELASVLSMIPESVTTLNLSYNALNRRRGDGDGLEEALEKISAHVTQIDLSFND